MKIEAMSQVLSGYSAAQSDWARFLMSWRACIVDRLSAGNSFNEIREFPTDQNLVPPGSDRQIVDRTLGETVLRLGASLPQSYIDFVRAVNGAPWVVEAVSDLDSQGRLTGGLFPLARIGWFNVVNPVLYQGWLESRTAGRVESDDYYRYGFADGAGALQDPTSFGREDLGRLILIGSYVQGGLFLLNASQVTGDGEMEAWILDSRLPGAARYRSFAELMQEVAMGDIDNSEPQFSPAERLRESPCVNYLRTVVNHHA